MRKLFSISLLLAGLGVAGCDLTGPRLSDDPNNPTSANLVNLFVTAEANLWLQSEGDLARTVCVWVQQCAGRLSQYFGIDNYTAIGDGDFWFSNWSATYGGPSSGTTGPGGGLIDLRRIQAGTQQPGVADSVFGAIALVMEAWLVGTAADVWGDIPYSEAVSDIAAPHLDPQQQVYTAIQAKLDTAIVFLSASGPTNIGPRTADLVYLGDAGKWARLAQTLKARFFMHTAEQDPAGYDSVLVHAPLGILPGEDYNNYHTTDLSSSNIWFQFFSTAAQDYIAAGAAGINLLQNANDPRLPQYYSPSPANSSVYVGGAPGGQDTLTVGTISSLSATRLAPGFRQPLVTWAEGQLLLAEAQLQTGNEPGALATLETVRADAGLTPLSPAPSGLAAVLSAIMTEKYIRGFQSIEVWSDYRRTCLPALTPAPGFAQIPARLPYPLSERNANPSITSPGPARNWNDPNTCP